MRVCALVWLVVVVAGPMILGCSMGCSGDSPSSAPKTVDNPAAIPTQESPPVSSAPRVVPRFTNAAEAWGLDFTFFNDAVPDRYFLPEIMGGGVACFDYDGDMQLDLYVMNGRPLRPAGEDSSRGEPASVPTNRFYRNVGGRFEEISAPTHTAHPGFGQGCAVGDYDADGFPDLYLTNYGANVLLRNNGDGTFEDRTAAAGVGDPQWGTSATWLDLDEDQDLDLYVVNYLDVTFENLKVCRFNGAPGYCGPGDYQALPDRVYLNQGDGTFVESSEALGLARENGKGLALAAVDLDHDLRPEIYVANDMTPNFLFTRSRVPQAGETSTPDQPTRLYSEIAAAAGCAVSDIGHNEASMGVACADFDSDGLSDIFLTHFYSHKNTLYRNLGDLMFQDDSRRSKIAATSFDTLGFGTVAFDFDRDTAVDLFITNGHVLGPLHSPYAMHPQLLHNEGTGRFDEMSDVAGPYFQDQWLGRGAAGGDFDNDGDLDLVVTHLDRPMALLRNDTATAGRHFLGLDLWTANRQLPIGGRVEVQTADGTRTIPILGGGSYLCSSDRRMLIGLGSDAGPVEVTIYWPDGKVETFRDLAVDTYWRITAGKEPLPLFSTEEGNAP